MEDPLWKLYVLMKQTTWVIVLYSDLFLLYPVDFASQQQLEMLVQYFSSPP